MAKIFIGIWCFCFILLGDNLHSRESLRKEVVEVAYSQLHVRELTGNNDGADLDKYAALIDSSMIGKRYAWCAMFNTFVYDSAGVETIHSAWSPDFYYKGKIKYTLGDLNIEVEDVAMAGDAVTYWNNSKGRVAHTGIVVEDNYTLPLKGSIYTVEGNTRAPNKVIRESANGDLTQGVYKKIMPIGLIYGITDHINK